MTPAEMAILVSLMNTKPGSSMNSSEYSRLFDDNSSNLIDALTGKVAQPYQAEEVDEDAITRRYAPNLSGILNSNFYKPDSIERQMITWIGSGKPLDLVKRETIDELKAQGKSTKSKDPYFKSLLALSDTLFDEHYAASAKIEDARSSSQEKLEKRKQASPYFGSGIPDPADYSGIGYQELIRKMEPVTARLAKRYAPSEGTDPKYQAGRDRVNSEKAAQAHDSLLAIRKMFQDDSVREAGIAQRDLSNNAMMKKIVLMKVMENPKLLTNPVIKSYLG